MLPGLALSLALLGAPPPSDVAAAPAPAPRPSVEAWLGAGFEQSWALTVGAGVRWPDARTRLDAQVLTPWVYPFATGGRVALGASRLLVRGAWIGLGGRAELGVPWSVDSTGSWLALDVGLALQPGVYRPRWSAALELGARVVLGALWSPSEPVRALFGDRPVTSAWSGPSGGALALTSVRLSAGATARVTLAGRADGAHVALFARGAFVALPSALDTGGGPPTLPLPFEALAGAACAY